MTEPPKRRWFRFSLRSLLIVVTVLCCWLGWESSVVRQRKAILNEVKDNPAFSITTAAAYAERFPAGIPAQNLARVSLVRRWLGDPAIQHIWYMRWYGTNFSEEQLGRLTKAFPEAEFIEIHPEPCHPGCFPRGTLVDTPQGQRAIEGIQPGDALIAFLASGEPVTAQVQSVFITDNRLWKVETADGVLLTTEIQPLCLAGGQIRPAGRLQPGDTILRRQAGGIHSAQVLSVSSTDRIEKVFNLVLGDSEVFVAGGFLARSKPPAETR